MSQRERGLTRREEVPQRHTHRKRGGGSERGGMWQRGGGEREEEGHHHAEIENVLHLRGMCICIYTHIMLSH